MRDPNEPSVHDCGAPWNEDDEGDCDCSQCRHRKMKQWKAERDVEERWDVIEEIH